MLHRTVESTFMESYQSPSASSRIVLANGSASEGLTRSETKWYLEELSRLTDFEGASDLTPQQESEARLRFAALRIRNAEARLTMRHDEPPAA